MNKLYPFVRNQLPWLILITICVTFFVFSNQKVQDSLPYPTHIDEKQRLNIAKTIMQTGNLNPGYFHKPTFHIYLTAIGLSAGFLKEASHGTIRSVEDIGSVQYPYYSHPLIVNAAKQLFILFSTLAIFLSSYAAYKAYRFKILIFLPALLVPFSQMYQLKTSESINVNILGAFFIAALLSSIFYYLHKPGPLAKAILPGLLCGMVVSSKYNFLAAYLPCLLAILLYDRTHWLSRTLLLFSISFLTILILNPYFILDLPRFLDHTAYQVGHYMHRGHQGYNGTPGVSQFTYYVQSIINEFGFFGLLFSLFGFVYMFKLDWKKTIIFVSFPVGMLILMSASKANFLRNLTPVYLLWPVFISMGAIYCYKILSKTLIKRTSWSSKQGKNVSSGVIILLMLSTLPYAVIADFFSSSPDSRNQVTDWIKNHVPKKSTLVISSDLDMDIRPLIDDYKVYPISRKKLDIEYIAPRYFKPGVYFLIPDYGLDSRRPGKNLLKFMERRITELFKSGQLKPVETFGDNKVLLNYSKSSAHGNPRFYLATYQTNEK